MPRNIDNTSNRTTTDSRTDTHAPRESWGAMLKRLWGLLFGGKNVVINTQQVEGGEAMILVLGPTGSGKSSFINTVTDSRFAIGEGLRSCTQDVQIAQSVSVGTQRVTLIDTPGFDDTVVPEADILMKIAAYTSVLYEHGLKPTGVILTHRISDVRVGGKSRKNFHLVRKLIGDGFLKNVAIVTTMWSDVDKKLAVAHEKELQTDTLFYKPILKKGGKMFRYENNKQSAFKVVSYLTKKTPLTLRFQTEIYDNKKTIAQTDVGAELLRELGYVRQKFEKDLAEVQKDLQRAHSAVDREELQESARDYEQQISRLRDSDGQLTRKWEEAKAAAKRELSKSTLLQPSQTRSGTYTRQQRNP